MADAQRRARTELWRKGNLTFKLHPDQYAVHRAIESRGASREVLEIARKWGKTWFCMARGTSVCLKKPRSRVVYGAPTYNHLREFILPVVDEFFTDAPSECRPRWRQDVAHLEFPNGSWIHFFGADDKGAAARGRGPKADAAIFDEAGFCPVLSYVIDSVFRPSLLLTGGWTMLASTPSDEPDHDFTRMAEVAEANGTYSRRTIHDNPLITLAQVEKFIADEAKDQAMSVAEYMKTDTFRREYLAERVTDKLLTVVPEWAEVAKECRVAVDRPEFFDGMTVLDMGGADPHAVSLGYWHFPRAKWVIEHELLLRDGQNTAQLAEAIKVKETEAWGTQRFEGVFRGAAELEANLPAYMLEGAGDKTPEQPHERWADNDLQMIADLFQLHHLAFIPTAKDDLKWQVNNLRVMMRAQEVLIHPRCVHTDRHLRTTVWENHKRKAFRRREKEHGDLVATLIYGARNVNRQRNPFPKDWRKPFGIHESDRPQKSQAQAIADAFLGDSVIGRKLLGGGGRRGGGVH